MKATTRLEIMISVRFSLIHSFRDTNHQEHIAILLSEIIRWRSILNCLSERFFFPLDKPNNDHYFFIGVPFYIKEAENDQQGQIGNGDEHANVEEGKKYSASQSNHISSLHLCRVLCAILFFPFSFLYLIPFFSSFSPLGEQIEMQLIAQIEIPEVEAPELPAPQPGQ